MGAFLSLLGGVPAKVWAYLVLALALAFGYVYWHHHVYDAGVASMQAKVDAANLRATQAEAANQGAAATIANLQASQAQCESGRLADQTSAARAIAGHDQAATLIHAQLVAEKAAVQALFDKAKNAECANWATQAACTP